MLVEVVRDSLGEPVGEADPVDSLRLMVLVEVVFWEELRTLMRLFFFLASSYLAFISVSLF